MIYQYLHLSTLFCKISTDFTKKYEIKFKMHFKTKSYHLIKFISSVIIHIYYLYKYITANLLYPPTAPPKIKIHRRRRSPQLFIIHHSLFITHPYHQCTISIPLVISIHGNYFHRIYYFCISHNIP